MPTGQRLEHDAWERAAAIVAAAEQMRRGNTLTREVTPPEIKAQLDAHHAVLQALASELAAVKNSQAQLQTDMQSFVQAAVAAAAGLNV